ncbi:photoreceptor cilium actin regulator [Boleophthalmus pectinirostris]|uniref:photoreceptor cilium actin regulator n=1 Tax=Boleophthalmus pectinirostris TaxID=150288 RepID=UPI00242D4E77|nr:photoreceptor cilium actin regulator [Boleophthalmus pectinirostris]
MGCAPSKGNNFGTLGPLRKGRMLPPPPLQNPRERLTEEGSSCNFPGSAEWDTKERKTTGQNQDCQKDVHFLPQKRSVPDLTPEAVNMDIVKIQGLENDTVTQKKEKTGERPVGADKKLSKKTKKNRSAKTLKKKETETDKCHSEQKVDFPEPLVRAHQGAYAFLNPSIVKYDSLIELLEQATQTQVLVQPMVSFMALRYEEIIQGLEEMAEEGEKVFKEYGEHLAWPSQMKNLSSAKCTADGESPPDLLQQLLQYTTQRMRNVSHSVGRLGDSALEEAVEYFASVSELLEEKLKAKHVAETRLMHLLCRIEMASVRKPGPEDSALFSEDSGIGGESESTAGSDKQHRPESCGSTGTNRTMSASPMRYNAFPRRSSRQMFTNQISPSVSLTSLHSLGSACTILANEQRDSILGSFSGEDDEDEVDEEIKHKCRFRPRSISVDSDHSRRIPPKRIENPQNMEMTLKMKNAISGRIQFSKSKIGESPKRTKQQWADDKEQTPKRPQTAKAVDKKITVTKARRSQSAESLRSKGEDPTLLELERTQKDLNQKLQKMSKNKVVTNTKTPAAKPNQRTPILQSPKRVRKNTSLDKNVQATGNKEDPVDPNKKKQEKKEDDDNKPVETSTNDITNDIKLSTPPTPPSSPRPSSRLCRGRNSVKKLIDTFSQGVEEREGPRVLGPLRGVKKCGVPVLPGLGNVEAVLSSGLTSCRPETESEKNDFFDLDSLPPPPIEVLMDKSFESAKSLSTGHSENGVTKVNKSPLPKRAMVSQRLKASVQPVTVLPSKGGMQSSSTKVNRDETPALSKLSQPEPQQKENNALCQQTRRIINIRSSHAEKPASCIPSETCMSENTTENTEMKECNIAAVPAPQTTVFAVPPSASVRNYPPSTPPASKTRMLPSTPTTSSVLHRRLPSPSNLRRQPSPTSSSGSSTASTPPNSAIQRRLPRTPLCKQNMLNYNSYPFKAPSPPASPKLQRWSRENSREDLSRKMNNPRSVFCPASPSLFEAPPCPVPKPPEAWTSSRVSFLSRMWGGSGRFPARGSRPLIRRTQSDRRPSLNLPPQSSSISYAETCGSEPMIYSPGLDDESLEELDLWGSQSELRATLRSASHPDLCVVGQSLHMD